jgi:hypothetical protein
MSDKQELVTATTDAVNVDIAKLDRRRTQLRVKMDPQAVEDYAESYRNRKACTMPPVVVFRDPDGNLFLGDGFHRCAAKELLGVGTIAATIREGSIDDAILFAAQCNRHNAVRWSSRDKRRAVKTLLEHFPGKPQRWIAVQSGCSHVLVGKVQRELRGEDEAEPAAVRSSRSRRHSKDREEQFFVASRELVRHAVELYLDGALDLKNEWIKGAIENIAVVLGHIPITVDPVDVADPVVGVVSDTAAVQRLASCQANQVIDAGDAEYLDAADEPPAAAAPPKRGRGRPPRRFYVTGSRGTWFVEDTYTDDTIDDAGPFDTKAEAEAARTKMEAEHSPESVA